MKSLGSSALGIAGALEDLRLKGSLQHLYSHTVLMLLFWGDQFKD